MHIAAARGTSCLTVYLAFAATGTAWAGACTASITGEGEETRIVMENEFLRAVICPHPDIGFIRELVYKPTGRQLSAYEHFSQRGGEGPATDRTNFGYLWRKSKDRTCAITRQTADEVEVALSYVWDDEREKLDYHVQFGKRYVLRRGESRLLVVWSMKNLGKEKRQLGPWLKHTMECSGEQFVMLPGGPAKCPGNAFFDATTNWLAKAGSVTDTPGNEETFFTVCEHGKVHQFYAWGEKPLYTLEALYAPAVIGPAETWSTTYIMAMTPNLPNVAYACPEGAIAMTPFRLKHPGDAEIKLQVAAAVPLGQVRLEGELLRRGKSVSPTGDRRIAWKPGTVAEIAYSFHFPETGAYLLRLNVYGADGKEHPLGREVAAYSPAIEIPVVVGKLGEGEVALEPWPKRPLEFERLRGRELALPVVAEAEGFRVALHHPTERVFREDRLAPAAPRIQAIHKSLARGEWESIPLIIFPGKDQPLANVKAELAPLRHVGSDAVLDRIRIFQVSHVPTTMPSGFRPLPVGRYPDPLIPQGNPLAVPRNDNAGIWLDVQAPLEAPPGDYRGEIHILADRGEARIPLVVKLWDFRLPCPPALKTSAGAVAFNVQRTMEKLNYQYEKGKPYADYCRWCLDYGFAPGHGRRVSLEEYLGWKDYNRGLSALCVGAAPWATGQVMKENGWEGRMWVYAPFDEHGDGQVPKAAQWCRTFKQKSPHVRILDVYYGTNVQPMEGLVDIWCRQKKRSDWTQRRLAAGDEFWSVNGRLLGAVEDEIFPGRREYWEIFSHAYTGQLLWSVVCWGDPPDFRGLGSNALAMLLYPIPNGVTTSIRWENMRDGLEDYDYLWLLRERARRAAEKGTAAPALLERARAICQDTGLDKRITSKENLESLRADIATLIERLR